MTTIWWNCRGIGPPATMDVLKEMIRIKKPAIIFLSETLATKDNVVTFVQRLGGQWMYHIVPLVGHSAGLILLWNAAVHINVLYEDKWIVHVYVNEMNSSLSWYLTGLYLANDPALRASQFNSLLQIKPPSDEPWVCGGDFNTITSNDEKWGGRDAKVYQTRVFNQFIDDAEVFDLGFVGAKYTWCNGQANLRRVYTRIDRVLITAKWRTMFEEATLYHVANDVSDHKILCMQLRRKRNVGRGQFRFEQMWCEEDGCKQLVIQAMGSQVIGSPSFRFCRKLGLCRHGH
ncbi:hypothetical protein ACHQM5_014119 [Ranunculus cassubicifolius]